MQKFSFPKTQNRQLIFSPRKPYNLVAERSETTASCLQFPVWWCYFSICTNLFRAENERMNRPATASQSLGGHQRKKFLAFRICARPISSKGERISQNARLIFFEFGCRKWKRRGLGRNFPFAPLFVLAEFGADKLTKNQDLI